MGGAAPAVQRRDRRRLSFPADRYDCSVAGRQRSCGGPGSGWHDPCTGRRGPGAGRRLRSPGGPRARLPTPRPRRSRRTRPQRLQRRGERRHGRQRQRWRGQRPGRGGQRAAGQVRPAHDQRLPELPGAGERLRHPRRPEPRGPHDGAEPGGVVADQRGRADLDVHPARGRHVPRRQRVRLRRRRLLLQPDHRRGPVQLLPVRQRRVGGGARRADRRHQADPAHPEPAGADRRVQGHGDPARGSGRGHRPRSPRRTAPGRSSWRAPTRAAPSSPPSRTTGAGRPGISGVEFRYITEPAAALTALQNGEVQWTDNVPPQQIAVAERGRRRRARDARPASTTGTCP